MSGQQEIHLTKKDFRVEWFSGTGKGGQHRNKHQNCCRITHINTGLKAQGTESRERTANQDAAFRRLARLLLSHFSDGPMERYKATGVIRNYHGVRNEVLDKASRHRESYKHVVIDGDLSGMIEARRKAVSIE